jgi:hypothetical protein
MRAASLMRGMTWAVVLSISTAASATAQRWALREVREWGLAGASAAVALPVGEFAEHVGAGGGIAGFMTVNLDRAGAIALRIDGSALAYGRATDIAYLDGPYYFPVGVTTTSFIVGLRAGPQLTLGRGPVRLYGFGQAGFSYFATTTSFGDYDCGCGWYDDITEQDDINWAWEAGGGMLVNVGRTGRVMLDLGARYLRNGRAQYLPASMVGDGVALPLETQANLVALHLGVTVGLR